MKKMLLAILMVLCFATVAMADGYGYAPVAMYGSMYQAGGSLAIPVQGYLSIPTKNGDVQALGQVGITASVMGQTMGGEALAGSGKSKSTLSASGVGALQAQGYLAGYSQTLEGSGYKMSQTAFSAGAQLQAAGAASVTYNKSQKHCGGNEYNPR